MKVRTLAILSILSLAAWLPLQAQQTATPAAPAAQSQAPAAADNSAKPQAKHDCCCAAKTQPAPGAVAEHDHAATTSCCHGKMAGDGKASCCAGKDAKEMSCCAKKSEDGKSTMNCCQGMKDAQCAAKGDKACCQHMNTKEGKPCCEGMGGQCAAHASGK